MKRFIIWFKARTEVKAVNKDFAKHSMQGCVAHSKEIKDVEVLKIKEAR